MITVRMLLGSPAIEVLLIVIIHDQACILHRLFFLQPEFKTYHYYKLKLFMRIGSLHTNNKILNPDLVINHF